MKSVYKFLLVAAALITTTFSHAGGIVVIDVEKALTETQAARTFQAQVQGTVKAEQDKVVNLEKQAKAAKAKLDENLGLVSSEQAEQLRRQFQQVYGAYQQQLQRLQQVRRDNDQAFLDGMRPKLREVMNSLIEAEQYDMVLDRKAVVFAGSSVDITARVIQLLDQQ